MRIETIEMRNFGSFVDATFDLSSVSAATVCGSNGAGKSTLCVDAPLFGLFGKCRTDADQMMRLGADEMVVTVTFTLNNQRYRVIRKRSKKTKAGRSELALQIASGDGWEDASGARMQDTQDKICALLNADFELITATGFLLQGSADRFSRATPAERKAILAQILRLDQYGPLKQAASRQVTIIEVKASEKATHLGTRMADAATLPSLEARQAEVSLALAESQEAIEQLECHQQDLTTKKAALAAELTQLDALPAERSRLQATQTELRASQLTKQTRRDRAAKIIGNRTTIEAKVHEEVTAKGQDLRLEEERTALAQETTALGQALSDVRLHLSEGIDLERQVVTMKAALDRIARDYCADTERGRRDIESDERACTLLQQVPCGTDLQARCQFTLQAVEALTRLPARRALFDTRYSTPGHEEEIAPDAFADLAAVMARHREWTQQGHDRQATDLNEQLKAVSTKQNDCERQRAANRTLLTELAKFTALVPELAAAEREAAAVDHDLAQHATELARLEQELDRLHVRLADRARMQAEHDDLMSSWQQDQQYLTRLRTDGQTAIGRLKEIELEIKCAQEAARQVQVLQQEIAQLRVDSGHFQALATAYTQIPVLILESSIPLLEEEANRILGKISTSGLRVTFNTQKALKSRDGLAETLDIVVRDVFGERPYEGFSGGEKARVDLAIRVGLSKLLANRAGAKIETLVVDEAFAAVDRDGVESLVESLPMLSQEFDLILFVTHDESFKSSIAQQIIVHKSAHGSTVEVLV